MPLILNIDSAVQTASVCVADGEQVVGEAINPAGRETAAWLHPAIQQLMADCGCSLQQLDAIAVSAGPGSYTGLRVSMATAKGLCYALNRPLITINTLQMMAAAALPIREGTLLCPIIDARRMEVFTALYNEELREVIPPQNMILAEDSFAVQLEKNRICFFGDGSVKAAAVINHPHAVFVDSAATARHMSVLALQHYNDGCFADTAYAEPFYGKDFYSPLPKKSY